MESAITHAELLTRLRTEVASAGISARGATGMLPFGVDAIDERLADAGLTLGLHDVTSASPDLAEDAAATLFVAGIAARYAARDGTVVWAVSRFDLYAPGLEQAGLGAERTLYIEARDDAAVLAVMEDALRSGAVAAVVGEVRRASMTATRRLQLAAADSGTPALLLRRWRRSGFCPLSELSAAGTRWRIGCTPSAPRSIPGVSRANWQMTLVRQRNGEPFTLTVEACDAQGRLALPAAVGNRTVATAGALARRA